MKRLLSTTTAIALAITPIAPIPVQAQTLAADGSVVGDDGTVLCTPTAEAPCDLEAITKEVKKAKKAAKQAEEEAAAAAAAQAEAEQKAAEEAAAAAAAQAEAEQKAAEEAAAAAAAQAEAEQKAAEEAAAAAAAQAEAEQKAAEEAAAAAAAQAEAEQKAAEEAAAAAAAQAEAEQKAAEEAAAAAAAQAEAEQKAAETPAVTGEVGDLVAVPDEGGEPETAEVVDPNANSTGQPNLEMIPAPEDETQTAPGDGGTAEPAPSVDPEVPVAEEIVDTEAVTVPPSEEEVQALTEILSSEDPATATATAAAAAAATGTAAVAADVSETVLTEEDTRASTEDFATTASGKKKDNKKNDKKKDKDEGLSDFEKAGLLALGALAVGAMLSNRDQVVANTGDRVVVQRSDGNYVVYKDDDALLRQPGSTVKTETFKDGSTRTTVTRADGTQVVTIRDATGRVLKRTAYDTKGRETVLIDDLAPEEPVVVSTLPKPRAPTISTSNGDAELAAALAAIQARELGRTFSLRQVRDIKEVRALAATVDVDNITFDSGSAAITTAQAENLADLGSFLKQMLAKNPYEIFLIEGHTDAVGSAAANLALSDRRAESVAKALTEYFGVPPENLVVQGYGEADLRIQTDGDERLNRRVAVRIITPLLMAAR